MQKIPGKEIADQILDGLKQEIAAKNLHPRLGVLLVGTDPASDLYVTLKQKAAQRIGVRCELRKANSDTPDSELLKIIQAWNKDPEVNGILIQLPLPEGHDTDALIAAIDPKKDADGFHPKNIEALQSGQATIVPPLHEGILRLIAHTGISPNHSLAIIVANTHVFADPLKRILEKAGATVRVMFADEKDDKELRKADIIVVAVGKLGFLNSNSVNDGAVVIDVGTNKTPEGKVRGDFNPEGTDHMRGWYSPVPGGVGPMTVAMLMKGVREMVT